MTVKKQKIQKLTKQQEHELEIYREKWFKIGTSSEPANRRRAEKAITKMYKLAGYSAPEFIWVPSPKAAVAKIEELSGKKSSSVLSECWWGQHEVYWIAFYLYCRDVLGVKYEKDANTRLDLWADIGRSCGWWWPYETYCIISDRTSKVEMENDREPPRIHNLDGPAVAFRDGWKIFAVRGMVVDARIIENPESITAKEITNQDNIEIRRILLERYGYVRYLKDVNAKHINSDEYGTLYRAPLAGDEDLCLIHVINSTPEPDGTFKDYWLRVPPETKTAHEGVAWTFDMTTKEYLPEAES